MRVARELIRLLTELSGANERAAFMRVRTRDAPEARVSGAPDDNFSDDLPHTQRTVRYG